MTGCRLILTHASPTRRIGRAIGRGTDADSSRAMQTRDLCAFNEAARRRTAKLAPQRSRVDRRGKPRLQKKKRSRPVSRVLSLDSHSSRLGVAAKLKQPTRERRGPRHAPLFGLAPSGVYRATRRCPRARCALTAPFHPYHAPRHPGTADTALNCGTWPSCATRPTSSPVFGNTGVTRPFGGLLSVALVVGSRRPGVTWHSALWSPDFPRNAHRASRLSGRLQPVF